MTIYAERIRKVAELDADRAAYNLVGFSGTAGTSATTDIDYKLTEERWICGGILLAKAANWGDTVSLQVIDKDNILGYGANTVLGEHVTDFYMTSDSEYQLTLESPYIALIPANIYIRVKYTNTSASNAVEVAMNLITHIPKK